MSYRRVTALEREQIALFLKVGPNQIEIADKLGFHRSTVSRELKRNRGLRGYRPKQAEALAKARQAWRSDPRKMTPELTTRLTRLLRFQWSPLQISKRLALENQETVSPETIYRFVYRDSKSGGRLFSNLRIAHRKRRPRFPRASSDRRGKIQDAISIEERTAGANNRSRKGHWEADTVIGRNHKGAVLILVDRKTRKIRLEKLERRQAQKVTRAMKRALTKESVRSITSDRGQEFSQHKSLSLSLKVPVYFCHAYTSSERGTVEQSIGVLRQYLPKGSDLSKVTRRKLKKYESRLNDRPMRCLNSQTPNEVCYNIRVALTM